LSISVVVVFKARLPTHLPLLNSELNLKYRTSSHHYRNTFVSGRAANYKQLLK